jgi:hypothetical protein
MVLPVRIELTTSPLPRGCSTTELRQQDAIRLLEWKVVTAAGDADPCHTPVTLVQGAQGGLCMNDQARDTEKVRRQQRLRAALRENLKRRKAQARGRAKDKTPGQVSHDSAGIVSDKDQG